MAIGRVLCVLAVVLGISGGLSTPAFASNAPDDPVYVRTNNGWTGLFAHNGEYAKFSLSGEQVQLQDAYHALLKQGLGVMVTFADKSDFADGSDLLAAHARWELNYWRSHADRVESDTRPDLSGGRSELRVTEIRVYKSDGARLTIFLIGLASKDGVFVLAVSPGNKDVEPLVKEIANSFVLVPHELTPEELSRVSKAAKDGPKEH